MSLKKYNLFFSFLLLYKYKYIFSYLYCFISKKKINKYIFFFSLILFNKISFLDTSKNIVLNYSNYNTRFHNVLCRKRNFSNFFSFPLLYENSYFF